MDRLCTVWLLFLTIFCCSSEAQSAIGVNLCDPIRYGCCGTGMYNSTGGQVYPAGAGHTYLVFDIYDSGLQSWVDWSNYCKFDGGRLVSFQSRREMDCVIKFINDVVDSTTMYKFAIDLHAAGNERGIFEWKDIRSTDADYDAPSPSFTNWKTGVQPSGYSTPCVYMEVGTSTYANGLWSASSCTTSTMLAVCEYEN